MKTRFRLVALAMLAALGLLAAEPAGARGAVLFAGEANATCEHEFAGWLVRDGFAIRALGYPGMRSEPLTWEQAKQYNVVVVTGLGQANTDGSLTEANQTTLATLKRFLAAGGGVFYVPFLGQMALSRQAQAVFGKELGLTLFWDDIPYDTETAKVTTAWKIAMAHTTEITASPVTDGVRSLWYPTATRAGAEVHVVPFRAAEPWQVVVTGSPTSSTRHVPIDGPAGSQEAAGAFSERVPLVAYRQVGPGRIVCCGINSAWLYGAFAGTTLEGTVRDRGVGGVPSDGYVLVRDAFTWLAEPSLTGKELGGAKTDDRLLANPYLTKFGKPWSWEADEDSQPFPEVKETRAGVIGARSELSGGKGSVADWVAAAKAAKLDYLVFLEDQKFLTKEKLNELRRPARQRRTSRSRRFRGCGWWT